MDIFQTLADGTRRQIVDLLSEEDQSVGELCAHFEISQPAISRHLRVLREGGLVASRNDAQRRVYTLTPEPLLEIDRWLDRHRTFWRDRLDRLDAVLLGGTRPRKRKKGKK